MKERPILFSAPMVRALLAGTKTQTRRIVKARDLEWMDVHQGLREPDNAERCPYGQPGDRLWVRETWQGPLLEEFEMDADADWHLPSHIHQYQNPAHCVYAADGGPAPEYIDLDDNMRNDWRPSIHMFRWASRITLEITSVRVERLQDISEADAMADGTTPIPDPCDHVRLACADIGCSGPQPYRAGFRALWQGINGPGSWEENPWVWVVQFNRVAGGAP